jgi:hypothetical protein
MAASSNQRWIAAVFRIIAVWIAVETLIALPGLQVPGGTRVVAEALEFRVSISSKDCCSNS